MKYLPLTLLLVFVSFVSHAQDVFELEPSQSMLMTGKGPGQDAVINPFSGQDCIAIVDNIGEKPFSVRLQSEGKIIEIIPLKPNTSRNIELLKGYELYLDTDFKTKARVKIEEKKQNP